MISINHNGLRRLKTAGKYCVNDIDIEVSVPNPTGKLTITDTAEKDVTNYAQAQVVDANLTSANIITGKTILGIDGSAVVPSGSTTITTNTTTDVTNYASVVTNIPPYVEQVSSVPSTKSSDIIYNTTDSSYYLWDDINELLCFTANTTNSTIEIKTYGTPAITATFEYSTDKLSWNTFTPKSTIVTLTNIGDKVYFRGNNTSGINSTTGKYYYFYMTGSISANGNIMSLIDNGACNTFVIPNDYCFYSLFYNCKSLTSTPTLPATTLTNYCYSCMFDNCTTLTKVTTLPATELKISCYSNMFGRCSSLVTAQAVLPATTLVDNCYTTMFQQCTSLIKTPIIQATTAANYCCYYMFRGCTSLTEVCELKATVLYEYCYHNMFDTCTALRTAPVISATTLAEYCYRNMFINCTSLTTPPVLSATTLAYGCYYSMFEKCTSLTTAPVLPANTLTDHCYHGMFKGCTALTTAPALPATELSLRCYEAMFSGCTSLVKLPSLPATALAGYCYNSMFTGCTQLQISDTQTSEASVLWRIPSNGVFTNTTTHDGMFYNCAGTHASASPTFTVDTTSTYYTQNQPV